MYNEHMAFKKNDKVPRVVLEDKEISAHPSSIKYVLRTVSITMIFTFGTAAFFHLVLVFVTALVRRDASLINPVEFLGIGQLFPELIHSSNALLIGWLFLVVLFWIVYRTITGLENIVAFWYTSETYNRLNTQTTQLKEVVQKLSESKQSRYTIKHLRSLAYITKSKFTQSDDH